MTDNPMNAMTRGCRIHTPYCIPSAENSSSASGSAHPVRYGSCDADPYISVHPWCLATAPTHKGMIALPPCPRLAIHPIDPACNSPGTTSITTIMTIGNRGPRTKPTSA